MIPPGTVCCILCRGMISYRNSDTTRFNNHMNYEHGAYFDMEFLLAACLMDEEERKAVRNVMELKYKSQKKEDSEARSSPVKRPNSVLASEANTRDKVPKMLTAETETETVVVKQEVPEEVELPESVSVKNELTNESEKKDDKIVMFKCDSCDKSFNNRKSLQTHQTKAGHMSKQQSEVPVEFTCKMTNCKYQGSKNKDLQSHIYRMHKNVPSVTPPPPSITPTPPESPSSDKPSLPNELLFNNMAKSWAKKKGAKALNPSKDSNESKKELDTKSITLEEINEKEEASETQINDNSTLHNSNVSENISIKTDSESAIDSSVEINTSEGSPIEDTTFVSIDSNSVNDTENPDEVNITKSKYFKANPQTVSTLLEEKGATAEQFTVEEEKLPLGWKVKEIVHEFKSGRKERKKNYLTPDLKILKTGLAVLEYMRLSGKYTAKEIMDYAKYLSVPVNRLEKYMELYL